MAKHAPQRYPHLLFEALAHLFYPQQPPLTLSQQRHPTLPLVLYISGSGALVERMAACGPDVISLCHTVDLEEAATRLPPQSGIAFQGNVDPAILFGSQDAIARRIRECVHQARAAGVKHVLNLGHGVLVVGDGDGWFCRCRVCVGNGGEGIVPSCAGFGVKAKNPPTGLALRSGAAWPSLTTSRYPPPLLKRRNLSLTRLSTK